MFNRKTRQPEPTKSPSRTPEMINQEYLRLAAELGELEFNYRTIPERQEEISNKIKALQTEMQAAQQHAQEQVTKAKIAAEKLKAQNPTAQVPSDAGVTTGQPNAQG